MRIWVKPDTLAKLGLTVTDSCDAVQQQNAVNPAGQVGAEPAPPGQEFTYTVRAQGRLVTAEEFGEVVVRANPDGSLVRLQRRGPHRAGRAQLQPVGPLQRQARRAHRASSRPRAPTRSHVARRRQGR